ncbi:SDR family oxidoreductase [Streptomyces sp. NPDC057717]|uniref:SDR family oxidoreductase n=1 Tax=Streptomyces sp. NPDC057717 TaxID=3346224 RepID=UPI0036ACA210
MIEAGSGVGQSVAQSPACLGARVAVWDLSQEGAKRTKTIEAHEGSAWPFAVDVADETAVCASTDDLTRIAGQIDFVVNCAGAVLSGGLEAMTLDQRRRSLEISVDRALNVCRAALSYLKEREQPCIVTVASAALSAYSGGGGYGLGPGKTSLAALSEQMAVEWGGHPSERREPGAADDGRVG